jgi:predicted  nucleic acid-binding Zn-ribbon protein
MEQTVEQKLKALYELQNLHTKIDKIRQIRGELPMEVSDLEDEVAGLETTYPEDQSLSLDDTEDAIVNRKNMIKEAQNLIKKYDTQLKDVKNNREYDALTKEVEIQNLEIQVCEKKIKEHGFEIASKTEVYEQALANLEARKGDLELEKR